MAKVTVTICYICRKIIHDIKILSIGLSEIRMFNSNSEHNLVLKTPYSTLITLKQKV